jgi:probable addiction module antidote protein
MTEKIKLSSLPTFDMAESLQTEEDIGNYLTVVLEEGDTAEWIYALGVVARARGMTEIAKDSGLSREALYKALRPESQPRFDTIVRVCKALGLSLSLNAHPAPKRLTRNQTAQGLKLLSKAMG